MRICFVADARSPIARNWIGHFIARRDDVHVISSYPCEADSIPGAAITIAPVALAKLSGSRTTKSSPARTASPPTLAGVKSRALAMSSTMAQHAVLPFGVRRQAEQVRRLIARIAPDIVHAMRIPFEGIVAAKATPPDVPLMISVWGNDFTLWAAQNPLIARQTRQALRRADALHTDCRRDLTMVIEAWSFDVKKPAAVLPGAGGIQLDNFHAGAVDEALRRRLDIAKDAPVIINPRGARDYVRNDVFFDAIPLVLSKHPNAIFLCVALQGNAMAERSVKKHDIAASVRLLPQVTREAMADLFRLSRVAVSPSLHDGTPNTMLEAMACGVLPVAGDIESVREWIDDGVNGLLCDATSVDSLAAAMIRALDDRALRQAARERNARLIAERAEYNAVMRRAETFYQEVIEHKRRGNHHG